MTATVELQDKIIAYRLKNGQARVLSMAMAAMNAGGI